MKNPQDICLTQKLYSFLIDAYTTRITINHRVDISIDFIMVNFSTKKYSKTDTNNYYTYT